MIATKKKITVAEVGKAYKRLKAEGWLPLAGVFCDCEDKKVCPLTALTLASYKRLPRAIRKMEFNSSWFIEKVIFQRLKKIYDVDKDFLWGIICGVDGATVWGQSNCKESAVKLGKKLYEKFIK